MSGMKFKRENLFRVRGRLLLSEGIPVVWACGMGPSAKSFGRSGFRLAELGFLSFIMCTWKKNKCVRQVQYVYFVNLIFVRKYVFMFLLDFFFF